jgi:hypothetical protein
LSGVPYVLTKASPDHSCADCHRNCGRFQKPVSQKREPQEPSARVAPQRGRNSKTGSPRCRVFLMFAAFLRRLGSLHTASQEFPSITSTNGCDAPSAAIALPQRGIIIHQNHPHHYLVHGYPRTSAISYTKILDRSGLWYSNTSKPAKFAAITSRIVW